MNITRYGPKHKQAKKRINVWRHWGKEQGLVQAVKLESRPQSAIYRHLGPRFGELQAGLCPFDVKWRGKPPREIQRPRSVGWSLFFLLSVLSIDLGLGLGFCYCTYKFCENPASLIPFRLVIPYF